MPHHSKKMLQQWVERVKNEEIPSFGRAIQDIISFTEEDASSATDLAQLILRDVSMTAKVIKVANSFYFNPQNIRVNTVSRAVISIGFNTIRDISLTIILIDTLARGASRQHLIEELTRSIHAAIQAKSLVELTEDEPVEEVFIETLLHKIGDFIFWSFSGPTGEQLVRLMEAPGYTAERAQLELLGFTLDELGDRLRELWNLPDPDTNPNPQLRNKTIETAYNISNIAEQRGWHSKEMKALITTIGKSSSRSTDQVMEMLHANARNAANLARNLGVTLKKLAQIIPVPNDEFEWDEEWGEDEKIAETPSPFPQPDGLLQLRILRELSQQIDEQPDFNQIMEIVLEGIYRGIGTDRALLAMLTPDRKILSAKTALGHECADFVNQFQFKNDPKKRSIFSHIMNQESCYLVDTHSHPELKSLIPAELSAVIGTSPFLVAPIIINKRAIGIFYADRTISGREIDYESYENFSHIVKYANMGLTLSVLKGTNP